MGVMAGVRSVGYHDANTKFVLESRGASTRRPSIEVGSPHRAALKSDLASRTLKTAGWISAKLTLPPPSVAMVNPGARSPGSGSAGVRARRAESGTYDPSRTVCAGSRRTFGMS